MRKILLILLSLILLVLAGYTVVYGIEIGSLTIDGISAIKEENAILEQKIQEASILRTSDYPENVEKLETAYKNLVTEKQNYEQILALGVDENGQQLSKIQEYEIEKIWITMGNYAKKQGVDLKLDVTLNNSISKTYDLTFTVEGGYIQITDFLSDVENDSSLVFKLENFKMTPGTATEITDTENLDAQGNPTVTTVSAEENLRATFVCKDVKLNISDSELQENTTEENTQSGTTDSSTTNTNSNTTSTNTTSTNTTNSTTSTGNSTNTTNTSNTTNTTN